MRYPLFLSRARWRLIPVQTGDFRHWQILLQKPKIEQA
jgi:hypothetical protein